MIGDGTCQKIEKTIFTDITKVINLIVNSIDESCYQSALLILK